MNRFKPIWRDQQRYHELYHIIKRLPLPNLSRFDIISDVIHEFEINSVWDYGCGVNFKAINYLGKKHKNVKFSGYEPTFIEKHEFIKNYITDEPVDMIMSTDVLEHIWEDELPFCFGYWKKKNPKYIYSAIHIRPSLQPFSDGENPHRTVRPIEWWKTKMLEAFEGYKIFEKYTVDINGARKTILLKKDL